MPAEVVVVVEDEHARRPIRPRPVEIRGRETADAAANDDEVERFLRVDRLAVRRPEFLVAQRVRRVVRSVVAAAHAGQRRRIVAGRILRESGSFDHQLETRNRAQPVGGERSANADGDAIQKVASRDRTMHAEIAIDVRPLIV